MSKNIVKALVTKKFSEAKDLVFQSLYAKVALAMDDARMNVASSVFNAPTEQVEEDYQTDARAETMGRRIDRADLAAGKAEMPLPSGKAKSPKAIKKGKRLVKAYYTLVAQDDREAASKKTFGRGGKVIK